MYLGCFEPGEIQNVVDDPEQMLLAAPDASQVGFLGVGERSAQLHLEQIDVAPDRIERSAQLVTHDCEELGFRAVGGICRSPRLLRLADDSAKLLVGKRKLVRELSGFVGLVLELARL